MHTGTQVALRETLTAMIGTYKQAVADIEQAYAMLHNAKSRLQSSYSTQYIDVIRRNNHGQTDPKEVDTTLKEIQRQCWNGIVNRLELKKMLSIKRREALDKQLSGDSRGYEEVPPLPELTEENVISMFQDAAARAPEYAKEAAFEVFDWLRPHSGRTADLKTNEKWRIGKKVIIGYAVEAGYRGAFRPGYNYEKNLTALDNVMQMLDGKGGIKSYRGPLCDAITESADGTGATEYYRFKCCKNRNLHLEFLRPDLIQKLNKMAGGNRLGNL